MPEAREIDLLMLMGVDATATRTLHTFSLLEKLATDQRKSVIDILFGLTSGFGSLFGYLTLIQVPTTTPYVVGISIAVLFGLVVSRWKIQKRGYGALAKARTYALYLDRMRRSLRQLRIASNLPSEVSGLADLKASIVRSLGVALDGLKAFEGKLSNVDFFTLGEDQEGIIREIETARETLNASIESQRHW